MATLDANLTALCADLDATALKEIIDTDMTDAQIHNFLNAAYYASVPLTGNLGQCGGASAQCVIIKFLAAHFMTTYEGQAKSESVGGEWSITYRGSDGTGLNSSLYGQAALDLDCSGKLAKLGMKQATIAVISYEDFE